LVRNLVRVIDLLPTAYGVGVITMFISTQSRRLGDFAAGTVVVKERAHSLAELAPAVPAEAVPADSVPAGSSDPEELSWSLHALTQRDLTVIREFLARAPSLPADARVRIGNEIAAHTASRIGARESLDPVQFLTRVLALRAEQ
jgi:hypothetical protein